MEAATPGALRRTLDSVYDVAAYAAGLCMIGLLAMILLGIVSRLLHFMVPGTDAYAGYLMAGAGFFALAHTLKRGEHIRVGLLISAAGPRTRKTLEVWSLAVSLVIAAALGYYSIRLAWLSYIYQDISTSNDATPLWIPQIPMALGACLLAVALLDEFILELRGQRSHAAPAEALRNE